METTDFGININFYCFINHNILNIRDKRSNLNYL